jgi:hypothetical protein
MAVVIRLRKIQDVMPFMKEIQSQFFERSKP